MDPITITHEQIMTALSTALKFVPVITGTYILFKIRGFLKDYAREIAISAFVMATIVSLSITTFNLIVDSEQEKELIRQKRKVVLEEKLPGNWINLYLNMDRCKKWASSNVAIHSLVKRYSPDDMPPLPLLGLDLILEEIHKNDYSEIVKILTPYIIPFKPEIKVTSIRRTENG